MARKKKGTGSYFDNPYPDDESLYNIYTLSFNNIMGSDSDLVRGRILIGIRDLELRARDFIEEFRSNHTPGIMMTRRSFDTHSMVTLRLLESKNKRPYVNFGDEKLVSFLAEQDEETRKIIESYRVETDILNANLKIEWTRYLEVCRVIDTPDDELFMPKDMPKAIGPALDKE